MNTKFLLALTAFALLLPEVATVNAAPRTWTDPNIFIDPTIPTVPGTPRPRLTPEIPTEIDPGALLPPVRPRRDLIPDIATEIDPSDFGEPALSLSCRAGKQLVRRMGYQGVRTRSCGNRFYVYSGKRRETNFAIRIDKFTAEVVSVRRLY